MVFKSGLVEARGFYDLTWSGARFRRQVTSVQDTHATLKVTSCFLFSVVLCHTSPMRLLVGLVIEGHF